MAGSQLPKLEESLLQPYLSFQVLTLPQDGEDVSVIWKAVKQRIEIDDALEVVAEETTGDSSLQALAPTVDSVHAIAFEERTRPPWHSAPTIDGAVGDNSVYHLAAVVHRGRLAAVHSTHDSVRSAVRRRADKGRLGGAGRLDPKVLQTALLVGEIRTLWMGEGSGRRRSGARTKSYSGSSVDVEINPVADQRHVLAAVRAAVSPDLFGPGARGSVGTSLKRSSVWYRRAYDWSDFVVTIERLLGAFDEIIGIGGGHDRFTVFAKPDASLDDVEGLYDIAFEELPSEPDSYGGVDLQDLFVAAEAAVEDVSATAGSSGTVTLVGPNGARGTVHIEPQKARGRRVELKIERGRGDPGLAELFCHGLEILSPVLYYASGHSVSREGVIEQHLFDATFAGWQFDRFDSTEITMEKPVVPAGSSLTAVVGRLDSSNRDPSLFGWALRTWNTGWLYCDDRANELFDFLHLDEQTGEIRVIHVKAAEKTKSNRRTAAAKPFEEVCAQVQKNLVSLSIPRLLTELHQRLSADSAGPLWHNGERHSDLLGLIQAIEAPRARESIYAVVVQPHVSDKMLRLARSKDQDHSAGLRGKLRRLEHLLVATDNLASGVGARLEVIAREEA